MEMGAAGSAGTLIKGDESPVTGSDTGHADYQTDERGEAASASSATLRTPPSSSFRAF